MPLSKFIFFSQNQSKEIFFQNIPAPPPPPPRISNGPCLSSYVNFLRGSCHLILVFVYWTSFSGVKTEWYYLFSTYISAFCFDCRVKGRFSELNPLILSKSGFVGKHLVKKNIMYLYGILIWGKIPYLFSCYTKVQRQFATK